jgi:hypothetical protein
MDLLSNSYVRYPFLRWLRRGFLGVSLAWMWYWLAPDGAPHYFMAFLGPAALWFLYFWIRRVLDRIDEHT